MVQRKCASPCGQQVIGRISSTRQQEQLWVFQQWHHRAFITCKELFFHICFKSSNSSLHPPQVKRHYKQKRDCDIWASTLKRLGPAQLFDISLEEHLCLWGQFSPTHLLTVLPLQDYKEFQMDLMMKNRLFFIFYIVDYKHGPLFMIYGS